MHNRYLQGGLEMLLVLLLFGCSIQVATATEAYQFVAQWGTSGSGDGEFNAPYGIALDGAGTVYVTDEHLDRVQAFNVTGGFIRRWGTHGSGDGQLWNPQGIAVDRAGDVFVVNNWNDCIQRFSSTGAYLAKWGIGGFGNGQFTSPSGVAVDSAGNVYVADMYNYRVQKFTSTGTFLAKWGTEGVGNGQFDYPAGIAVDEANNVYVVDSYNNRVQKFTSAGTFLTMWGTEGTGTGQFADFPEGIAVDSTGDVYVTDTGNDRIEKFTRNGTFVTEWGMKGSGIGQFESPAGIAVDNAGNVFVTDTGNHRIQKFAPVTPAPTPTEVPTVVEPTTLPTGIPTVVEPTITITVKPAPAFRFTPASLSIPRGSTNTTTLSLDGQNNTPGYNVTLGLTLLDPAIGEIVGVSLPGWTMAENLTLPSDTVWLTTLDQAGQVEPGSSGARIGTITIRGDQGGRTAIEVIQAQVTDDQGRTVSLQPAACQVEVTVPIIPLPGISSYPNDLNGDGHYEDVNGNGVPDFNDVVLFFNQLDWIPEHEPVAGFDFNSNGQIDFNDVVRLFNQV